jgi:hypothetical protein
MTSAAARSSSMQVKTTHPLARPVVLCLDATPILLSRWGRDLDRRRHRPFRPRRPADAAWSYACLAVHSPRRHYRRDGEDAPQLWPAWIDHGILGHRRVQRLGGDIACIPRPRLSPAEWATWHHAATFHGPGHRHIGDFRRGRGRVLHLSGDDGSRLGDGELPRVLDAEGDLAFSSMRCARGRKPEASDAYQADAAGLGNLCASD